MKRAIYTGENDVDDSVLNIQDLSKNELQDHFCIQTLSLRGSNVKVQKQSKIKICENFKSLAIFSEVSFMKNKFPR